MQHYIVCARGILGAIIANCRVEPDRILDLVAGTVQAFLSAGSELSLMFEVGSISIFATLQCLLHKVYFASDLIRSYMHQTDGRYGMKMARLFNRAKKNGFFARMQFEPIRQSIDSCNALFIVATLFSVKIFHKSFVSFGSIKKSCRVNISCHRSSESAFGDLHFLNE